MAKCIFENLTKQQAITLACWYEGQGEQDADIWFDINDTCTPVVDVRGKGIEITDNGNMVTVYCK